MLGSNEHKLKQYQIPISTLINKEIIPVLLKDFSCNHLQIEKKPPELLIFLLDDETVSAFKQLIEMSVHARPALLVIAEDHNSQQMRLAMQSGARDFFITPLDNEELLASINKIIFDLRQGKAMQGLLTTVINAKGGSGGSFIACNLAHIASVLTDESVVLMDFDMQFGAQSLNLNLNPQYTIIEALKAAMMLDFDAIDGYMAHHDSGLRLLSSTGQLVLPGEVPVENLEHLLSLIISHYKQTIIDLPRQIDPLSATILERSDQNVIIVQQSLAHLRDAKRLTDILKSDFNISERNIHIVVNRYDANSSIKLNDIQTVLGASKLFQIPNDYHTVSHSTNLGIPLYDYERNAAITKAMIVLAEALNMSIKDEFKEKSFFTRLFGSNKSASSRD